MWYKNIFKVVSVENNGRLRGGWVEIYEGMNAAIVESCGSVEL